MVEKPRRADAQRSRDRILEAAQVVISRDGAEASLEEIARTAGVGSATLHRHFASRWELLDAVFIDRVDELCRLAESLAVASPAGEALGEWLRTMAVESARNHGLAASMFPERAGESDSSGSCHLKIHNAGEMLLGNAIAEGAVRPDVSFAALFALISAVVTSAQKESRARNESMIALVLHGIYDSRVVPAPTAGGSGGRGRRGGAVAS
jgi:AcrR family transcriptional regulator